MALGVIVYALDVLDGETAHIQPQSRTIGGQPVLAFLFGPTVASSDALMARRDGGGPSSRTEAPRMALSSSADSALRARQMKLSSPPGAISRMRVGVDSGRYAPSVQPLHAQPEPTGERPFSTDAVLRSGTFSIVTNRTFSVAIDIHF